MAEQARLDVLRPQRLAQERILLQVDLPDRQVVRGPSPAVDEPQLLARHGPILTTAPQRSAEVTTAPAAIPAATSTP
ncbi:MAG: hypothetical protein ACXWLM_12525, partial [Myxococcales bacterium]